MAKRLSFIPAKLPLTSLLRAIGDDVLIWVRVGGETLYKGDKRRFVLSHYPKARTLSVGVGDVSTTLSSMFDGQSHVTGCFLVIVAYSDAEGKR